MKILQNQTPVSEYLYTPSNKNLIAQLMFQSFWKEGEGINKQFIQTGELLNQKKNTTLPYFLTVDGYFCKFENQCHKKSCLLDNIYTLKRGEKCFTLQAQKIVKQYHCKDENSLNEWINKLGRFCILKGVVNTKYQFLSQISTGNFSKGFLVQDQKGMKFISKTFQKIDLNKVPKLRDSIIGEILLLRKFNNPGVLKILEVHEDDNSIYLIFENIQQELYQEFTQRKKEKQVYREMEVSNIMKQILIGLEHVHSYNVVHRDIKLENLVYKDRDTIVIADFGLAATLVNNFEYKKYGTPGYIAPEVLNLNKYNEKIDIFSLGVVCYILLTQTPVFIGSTLGQILTQNTAGHVDFNNKKFKGLSTECQYFLRKLLTLQENDRPGATQCLNYPFIKTGTQFKRLNSPKLSNNQNIKLYSLTQSIIPQTINLKKAKRKSMRQYILLKQALNTHTQQQQMLEQIAEQQKDEEEQDIVQEKEVKENEELTVTESVHCIANSFYTQPRQANPEINHDWEDEEELDGADSDSGSDNDSDLFIEDDLEHSLATKLNQLNELKVKTKLSNGK